MQEKSKKQKLKAIVADDDRDLRSKTVGLIKKVNPEIEIDEVWNGEELVKKVRKGKYDFVVTDNQMGEMSGIQATEKMRKEGYRGPICLYAAMTHTDEVKKEAKKAGVTDLVNKIDSYDSLLKVIRKYSRR